MPHRVRLSPKANADLRSIAGWITNQAGSDVALAYADRVHVACEKIADMPNGGTPQPKWGSGYRSIVFERRLRILYRVEARAIVIKRILHGSRDLRPGRKSGRAI